MLQRLTLSFVWLVFILFAVGSDAWSEKPADVQSEITPEAKKNANVLWDTWYTVTIAQNVHYAYYHETVKVDGDRLHFETKLWKLEEGYINEEQIGAYSRNTPKLEPLFFNFHSSYRSTETSIDGTVNEKGVLVVRTRKGKLDLPIVNTKLSRNTILSIFFPIWIGKNFNLFKETNSISFNSILEDNLEVNFKAVPGRATITDPDPFAINTKTHKFSVSLQDIDATWWMKTTGEPFKIVMPKQKTVIEATTQEKAESFFD